MAVFTLRLRFALLAASCLLAAMLVMVLLNGASTLRLSTELDRPKTKFSCSYEDKVIPDGGRIDLYHEPSVPFGEHCVYESRYCKVGILTSGFYTYPSCYVRRRE